MHKYKVYLTFAGLYHKRNVDRNNRNTLILMAIKKYVPTLPEFHTIQARREGQIWHKKKGEDAGGEKPWLFSQVMFLSNPSNCIFIVLFFNVESLCENT